MSMLPILCEKSNSGVGGLACYVAAFAVNNDTRILLHSYYHAPVWRMLPCLTLREFVTPSRTIGSHVWVGVLTINQEIGALTGLTSISFTHFYSETSSRVVNVQYFLRSLWLPIDGQYLLPDAPLNNPFPSFARPVYDRIIRSHTNVGCVVHRAMLPSVLSLIWR